MDVEDSPGPPDGDATTQDPLPLLSSPGQDSRQPRPHVVTHTLMSVDGRLEGFPPDVGRYYELAAKLPHDAVLAGSGTMVAAAAAAGVDLTADDRSVQPGGHPSGSAPEKPLLVVVDSQGQLTRFDWLRETGLFGGVMVLGSSATPRSHHARLRDVGVDLEVFGDDKVDLRAALASLRDERAVDTIRVDAGPGLNSALLAAGLVDEVSVLLAPYLVGDGRSFLGRLTDDVARRLDLISVDRQPDGYVWLRYSVPT